MKFNSKDIRKTARSLLLLGAASLSMAFTLPSCPNADEMNEKMSTLEKKVETQQKAVTELNNQLRTLTDEHNTMKQLVSQISTTVLEQKDALEKLDTSVKEASARRVAPAATTRAPSRKPVARKRR